MLLHRQIVKLATALALAIGSYYVGLPRIAIFAVIFVFGAARAFEMPALAAFLPGIVPETMLPRAIAGSASANQAATIGGPALGGLLYAVSPALPYGTCGVKVWMFHGEVLDKATAGHAAAPAAPAAR